MKPWLTKSRFVAGQQCHKRLRQQCHDRLEDSAPTGVVATGNSVGELAHRLFPKGYLVDSAPQRLGDAVVITTRAVQDGHPAVFEATLASGRLLVRIDILERLTRRTWGIREVKSSTRVKDEHLEDLAFQVHVARLCGFDVRSAEIVHVNSEYVRAKNGIDVKKFFQRDEVLDQLGEYLADLEKKIDALVAVIDQPACPSVAPWDHCYAPTSCEFLDRCTEGFSEDWVLNLPRLGKKRSAELQAAGVQRIGDIPSSIVLTPQQEIIRDSHRNGKPFIAPALKAGLKPFRRPALYLDFESMAPAIPLHPKTRPYQRLPFQWSMHRAGRNGNLSHVEFLADALSDPREPFLDSLLAALGDEDLPIVVYSGFEKSTLAELAAAFPRRKVAITRVINRLVDLLPVVSNSVYYPAFNGSFSTKAVGPVLASSIRYDELEQIGDGGAASAAFEAIASGLVADTEEIRFTREALLRYCHLDTLAMVEVHNCLGRL